jgi:hypothetical protein
MRRSLSVLILAVFVPLAPLAAHGQGMGPGNSTPLALDLKKVAVGSWAEYTMTIGMGGGMTMKSRWALVGRNASGNTLEMSMEGGPMAMMGGKMVAKMVLVPDPVGAAKPVKQMVMQMGDRDPMEMPLDMPGMPAQKFQKPDPKKLVGKEDVKVPAGTFKASHYRDKTDNGTVDAWVSEDVAPLGMIKVTTSPKPGAVGPNGQPMPSVTMELVAKGKDAKPTITKTPKPFDPSMFGGGHGGPPPGAKPAGSATPAPAPAPAAAPAKK